MVLSGFDVKDITEADPVAIVTFDAQGGHRELARFVGMCVVAMLRIAVHTPGMTEPFATLGSEVSGELAEPPDDADLTEFSIAAGVRPDDVAGTLEHEAFMAEINGGEPSMDTMLGSSSRTLVGSYAAAKSAAYAPSSTRATLPTWL